MSFSYSPGEKQSIIGDSKVPFKSVSVIRSGQEGKSPPSTVEYLDTNACINEN